MVNRGGRSKACKTCKRRRVKCDQRKPHCQRCYKAGLRCEGYLVFGQFVDETPRFNHKPITEPNKAQIAHVPSKDLAPFTCSPSYSLINKNDMIHTHLISRLDSPEVQPLFTNHETPSPVESTRTLAVRALAAVYFGKTNGDRRIFEAGNREYVRALRRLQLDLASPTAVLEWDTLASALCLGMYENVVFSERTGWLKHYEGISQLIVCALVRRRHCYLSHSEWRAIPTSSEQSQTPSDVLHDIFAHVPGLLHDFDCFKAAGLEIGIHSDLLHRTQSTLEALYDWQLLYQHQLALLTASPTTSVEDRTLLALQKAIILCMARLCEVLQIPLVPTKKETPFALSNQRATREFIAVEICQLAISCIGSELSSTGPLLSIFPLQIASMNLESGSVEGKLAEEVMNEAIAGKHGFEIGRRRTWVF
ncbi:hypothetical protein F66182_7681 [Fusarium sp. NRRL 66182]|nr:hypothetical protein F66182_7681 [Fusarium sp. NRRL 66182]